MEYLIIEYIIRLCNTKCTSMLSRFKHRSLTQLPILHCLTTDYTAKIPVM